MTISVNPDAPRVDQFLMAMEARFDRWRALLQAARTWERSANQLDPNKGDHQAAMTKFFRELLQWEDFFAYPGQALLKSLEERIASGDAVGTVRLVQSISTALLTHSYRSSVAAWENEEQSPISLGDRVPDTREEICGTSALLRSARRKSGAPDRVAGTGTGSPQSSQAPGQICL